MNQSSSTILGKQRRVALGACIITALLAFGTMTGATPQKVDKTIPAPNQRTVELGMEEVKQLVLLMDTDKNGKISKKEFMSFMEAEFDRLDTDKSGELDVRELKQSKVRASKALVGK
jgi:hypothetical protein